MSRELTKPWSEAELKILRLFSICGIKVADIAIATNHSLSQTRRQLGKMGLGAMPKQDRRGYDKKPDPEPGTKYEAKKRLCLRSREGFEHYFESTWAGDRFCPKHRSI